MGVVGSIFEPQPQSFGKIDTFRRSKNYIIIIFGNFHHYKSFKKYTQARRPGVKESLVQNIFCLEIEEHGFHQLCSLAKSAKLGQIN